MKKLILFFAVALSFCLLISLAVPKAEATNSLQAASRVGEPGQPALAIPISGMWEDSLLGYTISFQFDTAFIRVIDVNLNGTVTGGAGYFVPQWNNVTGYLTAEVVMGTTYPDDFNKSIPPGSGSLLNLVVDIKKSAPYADSTILDLIDGLGIPSRNNRFFWNDGSIISPDLQDGLLRTIYVWYSDFEQNGSGFSGEGEWEYGQDPGDDTNHLWGTELSGPYETSACYALQASFGVPVGYESAYLTFWHKYNIHIGKSYAYDGGNVQALVPPAIPAHWAVLQPDWIDYDVDSLFNDCLKFQAGYTGQNTGWPTGMVRAGFDLSDYVSPRVGYMTIFYDLRWVFSSDEWPTVADGWFIDKVRVAAAPTECGPFFIRGDVDNDGLVNVSDVTYLNNYLFSAGPPPPAPCDRADLNDDGQVDVSDVVYLTDFLYNSGPAPAWPYPYPGIDSTPDNISLNCGKGGKMLSFDKAPPPPPTSTPPILNLRQNSPNPFNPLTEIEYELPQTCHVKLEVYNSLGQKIATIIDADQEPGLKTVHWDASSLPSGLYFYKLQAGSKCSQTKKMILLK